MNIISVPIEDQKKSKDMIRTGNGGDRRVAAIKEDLYEIVMQDGNLICERDRLTNKINKREGKLMLRPTLAERIERIIEKHYGLDKK